MRHISVAVKKFGYFVKIILRTGITAIAAAGLLVAALVLTVKPADRQPVDLWQDVSETSLRLAGQRRIVPDRYRVLRLDKEALRAVLIKAPAEFARVASGKEVILDLPLPDGTFSRFSVRESPIMHPALAAKYPAIKTYIGRGIDDPTALLRFDLTPAGFHGQILRAGSSVYIDPYSSGDTSNYISYLREDFAAAGKSLSCGFSTLEANRVPKAPKTRSMRIPGSAPEVVNNAGTLQSYRLALAATGEYTAFTGGTKAAALAAMVTSMNRVNGVYERDLSMRMVLIANNDLVIYTDAVADPYTNDDGAAMLDENQATLDAVIGDANYDIGHVFSTGGGGIALLEAPCETGSKAQGVTGSPAPVGDPFDIDYVAHEMGHQWGADHTFNGSTLSCAPPNRSLFAGVEPGSGVTIMAYAGICLQQDLQPHSIDTFHVYSLEEIIAFSRNPSTGGSCDVSTTVTNTAPTVTAPASFNVPKQTPFKLTASATDAEDAGLTYNWEEYYPGLVPSPPDDDIDGLRPLFRSYGSQTSPSRTFPSMQYVLNNGNSPPSTYDCGRTVQGQPLPCLTGESLPLIEAAREYQVTVRDNHAGGGGVRSVLTTVNISSAAGPFKVTQPDTNVNWTAGSARTITWLAAATDLPPVSTPNVNILLSINGGTTFPYTLASNTPNDGTQSVVLPTLPVSTSAARVLIEGAGNIFFDVSDVNFSITAPPTAAPADIGGRIVDASNTGIGHVVVHLAGQDGTVRLTAITNPFGYYRFTALPTGQAYMITPAHKRYSFEPATRIYNHMDEATEVNFTGTGERKRGN